MAARLNAAPHGAEVHDELELYAQAEKASLDQALVQLGSPHVARMAIT
jgi:hypothetical protein